MKINFRSFILQNTALGFLHHRFLTGVTLIGISATSNSDVHTEFGKPLSKSKDEDKRPIRKPFELNMGAPLSLPSAKILVSKH